MQFRDAKLQAELCALAGNKYHRYLISQILEDIKKIAIVTARHNTQEISQKRNINFTR